MGDTDWASLSARIVQGLTTTLDAVKQLDTQEAAVVMKLLGKTCTKMMKEGAGHQFGISMIETSEKMAMKDSLALDDVAKMIMGIIGKLYLSAKNDDEVKLVMQLENVVKSYPI
ncbi:MAG: recombinase [Peptococcaceae bacterium]|nr:recombinase [Peptococcaceae bacterium]